MFTGIITDLGELAGLEGTRLKVRSHYPANTLERGGSLALDGCCLTIVALEPAGGGALFEVDASNETLSRTTLGTWEAGRRINLERPLVFGAELGGHIVSGHVDGVARIVSRKPDGDSARFVLGSPSEYARFIAAKGSVALNGVSLTVNEVDGTRFGVNIIPYTLTHTTWRDLGPGDLVNLEVDLLARYVERIAAREAVSQ